MEFKVLMGAKNEIKIIYLLKNQNKYHRAFEFHNRKVCFIFISEN